VFYSVLKMVQLAGTIPHPPIQNSNPQWPKGVFIALAHDALWILGEIKVGQPQHVT
jgi:4'-phosphopantetheinyl transferase EntD